MASNPKFTGISTQQLNTLLQSGTVRRALRDRAARTLPRTRAIAYSTGAAEFAKALEVEEGIRPGAGAQDGLRRPYARIRAEITPEMKRLDGRTQLTRRMILRRGAHG